MDSTSGGPQVTHIPIKRRKFFEILTKLPPKSSYNSKIQLLELELKKITNCPEESIFEIKKIARSYCITFTTKWNAVHRVKKCFIVKNKKWLDEEIFVPFFGNRRLGRPSSDFLESSERSKRRKTEHLRSESTPEALAYAAQMNLRATGKLDASKLIKDATFSSPARASKYLASFSEKAEISERVSADGALSLLIDAQLSRHQYEIIRSHSKSTFPSYKILQEAKKNCYPETSSYKVEELKVEVNVQKLLDHTAQRIIDCSLNDLSNYSFEQLKCLKLISKWGCDGSSGQSQYKQKFESTNSSDSNIFLVSCVPLQLYFEDNGVKNIIWKNPRPASPRFCRPILIQFIEESTEYTKQIVEYIENQINSLTPTNTIFNNLNLQIIHNVMFTMVDGKICNAVTSTTSPQRCYICGSTSKDFNNISESTNKEVNTDTFRFGLSTLHAWIRFFECLLHIAYRLGICKWQVRGNAKKEVEEKKKYIQEKFKKEMGLVVDRPKVGSGNTNDGNTARRFFRNSELSAAITGVDERIIIRFRVILQTISSCYDIREEKFREYCKETARLYVNLYPWFYMPTTVHKILIHGPEVVQNALVPIGMLSEEAQEALNKYFKNYRESFSRKCSRDKNLLDVFNRLMLASDPVISSLQKLPKKRSNLYSEDVKELLCIPQKESIDDIDSDYEEEYSSVSSDSD